MEIYLHVARVTWNALIEKTQLHKIITAKLKELRAFPNVLSGLTHCIKFENFDMKTKVLSFSSLICFIGKNKILEIATKII